MWTLNMSSTRIDWIGENVMRNFKWDVNVLIKSLVILNRLRKCVMNKWRWNEGKIKQETKHKKKQLKIKIKNSFWWTMHNILINETHHHIRRIRRPDSRDFSSLFSAHCPCHVWQTIFCSHSHSLGRSLADVNLSFVHFVILWHMMLRWIFLKYGFVLKEERGRNIKCLNTIFCSLCGSLRLSPDVTFHFERVIYSNIPTAHRDDATMFGGYHTYYKKKKQILHSLSGSVFWSYCTLHDGFIFQFISKRRHYYLCDNVFDVYFCTWRSMLTMIVLVFFSFIWQTKNDEKPHWIIYLMQLKTDKMANGWKSLLHSYIWSN